MITCLGLIVGVVETPNRNKLAEKCLTWLTKNRHLLDICPSFEVEKIPYLQLLDYCKEDDKTYGYFRFSDGEVVVVAQ